MSNREHFGDVARELDGRGVLGGDAWTNQEKIEEQIAEDRSGVAFTCHCQRCSQKVCVTISWIELTTAACKLTPVDPESGQPWQFHNGYLYPPVTCGCSGFIAVPITPDKADRLLGSAVQAGIFPAQAVANEKAKVMQMAQAGRR